MTKPAQILAVDDDPFMLSLVCDLVEELGHKSTRADSAEQALEILGHGFHPDLILTDLMMPGMNGFQLIERVRSMPEFAAVPIVMVTSVGETEALPKALEGGADDFIRKPIDINSLKARIRSSLRAKWYRDRLEHMNSELELRVGERTKKLEGALKQIKDLQVEAITRLASAAEYRDNETGQHIRRIGEFSKIVAAEFGFDDEQQSLVVLAAPMHDVGKIGIPDDILLKPGPLTPDEWKVMREHTTIGAQILGGSPYPVLQMAEIIALTHHEKWDGSGYPRAIREEDIPIEGRIVAVCDVFDAVTSKRPYKEAWPIDVALQHVRDGAGKHFDPAIVEAFMARSETIVSIKKSLTDEVNLNGPTRSFSGVRRALPPREGEE